MRISDWSSDVCSSDLALRQMLLAVPVERGDGNEHRALGPRLVCGIVQAGDEVRVLGDVDEAGAATDLQAAGVRVVDQAEGATVVGPEGADAQLLAGADAVGLSPHPAGGPLVVTDG